MNNIIRENGEHIYCLTSSVIRTDDHYATVVYGISVIGKENRAAIRDISDDYDLVLELFELAAAEELYPEHLGDVVEDYLADHLFTRAMPYVYPKRIA